MIRKIATTIRCVPRFGFEGTEVRGIDIDLPSEAGPEELFEVLRYYFACRGIADAVYDIQVDDNGYFAVVNDEAFGQPWGARML